MLASSTHRLRRGIARRADRLLGSLGLVDPRPQPVQRAAPAPEPTLARTPEPEPEHEPEPEPTLEPTPPPQPEPELAPADGPGLDRAEVEAILDEMVRPALQSDGGDIALVRVEGGDVYVRLVGACSSCPSSVLTMKMGIERLLEEELPAFRRLIQLEG